MVLLMSFMVATLLAQAPASPTEPTVAGRVVDGSTQAPVSGARVMLIPDGPGAGPIGNPTPTTQTDRDGRYAFASVAPGRYRLNVVKTGFTMPGDLQRAAFVVVKAGEHRAAVLVQMQRAAVIAGRITDEAGEPVTDARVAGLRRPPGSRGDLLVPGGSTQVNDLGEFRLVVPPGEYYVQASASPIAFASAAAQPTTLVPTFYPGTIDQHAAQAIVVDSGQTYSDVVIRLIEAAAFHVSGIVRNEGGQPVANALVRMTAEGASARLPLLGGPNLQVHTDVTQSTTSPLARTPSVQSDLSSSAGRRLREAAAVSHSGVSAASSAAASVEA